MNARKFVMRCQESFRGDGDARASAIVSKLLSDRFLILDDLGTVKPTEYAVQMLTDLVDTAYTEKKVLLVTSNKTLDELVALNADLGVLTSRLVEMCDIFEFPEADYPVRINKARTANQQDAKEIK